MSRKNRKKRTWKQISRIADKVFFASIDAIVFGNGFMRITDRGGTITIQNIDHREISKHVDEWSEKK